TRANAAFHQTASPSYAATPVPASTGATAAGKVRGRGPATHWPGVVTRQDSSRLALLTWRPGRQVALGGARSGVDADAADHDARGDREQARRAPLHGQEREHGRGPDRAEGATDVPGALVLGPAC